MLGANAASNTGTNVAIAAGDRLTVKVQETANVTTGRNYVCSFEYR